MEQIEIDARVIAKFAPFLDKFGHGWTSLDSSRQVCTTLDLF